MPGRTLPVPASVSAVGFLADGTLAAVCSDGRVRLLDTISGALRREVVWDKGDTTPALGATGDTLLAVGKDGAVKLWDLQEGRLARRIAAASERARRVAVSRDRALVAAASLTPDERSEQTLYVWDRDGLARLAVPAGVGGTASIAFSPDGGVVAAASYDANVRIFRTRDGELIRLIDEILVATFAMQFSPDGRLLATGGADGVLYLWDASNWRLLRKLSGQPELISALAFSPDGRYLVTGGFNEVTVKHPVSVLFWEVSSGRILAREPAPRQVTSVAFAPDNRHCAAAWSEKAIGVWSVG